ncbi:MAG: PEP/pyruvate-binding domain-containing protein [Candidatus Micrarchaeia archaeon]
MNLKHCSIPTTLTHANPTRSSFLMLLKNKLAVSGLTEQIKEKYWTIYGTGSIGAKAEKLLKDAWAIEKAGFELNPRVVLSMDFFCDFLERNGIYAAVKRGADYSEIKEIINNAAFNSIEKEVFLEILEKFEGKYLAVRSSAYGDSSGTGIYESVFHAPVQDREIDLEYFIIDIKRVLTSEFSEKAVAFKDKLNLPSGMAVLIEPVFGRYFEDRYADQLFGPDYGGIAFTSYGKSGRAKIFFSAGLPTKTVEGKSIPLIEGDERDIFSIIFDYDLKYTRTYWSTRRIMIGEYGEFLHEYSSNYQEGILTKSDHYPEIYFQFTEIFEKLKTIEALLGQPQYIEWALSLDGEALKLAIVQISDFPRAPEQMEITKSENTFLSAIKIMGSGGHKKGRYLVEVRDPEDVFVLNEFNRSHKNYCVFFPDEIVSKTNKERRIDFEDISNSLVLVEYIGNKKESVFRHDESPEHHTAGLLRKTGTTYIMTTDFNLDRVSELPDEKRKILEFNGPSGKIKLRYWDLEFEVFASIPDQEAVLNLLPDSAKKE